MSDEIRTVSATGGEKGTKAQRYDLLPKAGLDAIAEVFAFGATKYADHNWRRGYEWSKSYAAAMRHMTAFWDGETNDPESGLPHLGHAGFHILAMLTWLSEQEEGADNPFDDRWPAGMERARREKEASQADAADPDCLTKNSIAFRQIDPAFPQSAYVSPGVAKSLASVDLSDTQNFIMPAAEEGVERARASRRSDV